MIKRFTRHIRDKYYLEIGVWHQDGGRQESKGVIVSFMKVEIEGNARSFTPFSSDNFRFLAHTYKRRSQKAINAVIEAVEGRVEDLYELYMLGQRTAIVEIVTDAVKGELR